MKNLKNFRSRFFIYITFVLCGIVICFLIVSHFLGFTVSHHNNRLINEKVRHISARREINQFKEIKGRYPNSLEEVREYAKENLDDEIYGMYFVEYLSSRGGNDTEHSILNGKGGHFYDKSTGEIRINLTKELHYYLPLIGGKERNEIPAKW
jgi:hypothetical protein